MSGFVARVRVLLGAAPTWLTTAAVVVSAFNDEIGEAFPGAADEVAAVAAPVLAAIGAAIAIVRRVTPVAKDQRGLLPSAPSDGDEFGGAVG